MAFLGPFIVGAGVIVSYLITAAVLEYAKKAKIVDVPNHRSSHSRPTPRGGGLAIAVTFLGGTLALGLAGVVPACLSTALVGAGIAVAAVGWLDDRFEVAARVRLVVHFAAAGWVVWCVGGITELDAGTFTLFLGPLGYVASIFGIVWFINLYNFMDGIDGLAATEAVIVGVTAALLSHLIGRNELVMVASLVASASTGFLLWNWQPARIFMGDVGSGLLGLIFATLMVYSEATKAIPAVLWLVLLGVFVVDATATLLSRVIHGHRPSEAHRTHAYQLAVSAGFDHSEVVRYVIVLNVALAGVAWFEMAYPVTILPASLIAYAVLFGLWYMCTQYLAPSHARSTETNPRGRSQKAR